ncbi:hypothetical protein DdX_11624 [Ditylenchus destructor]|uniref:Uncharacterized protein n=1 Tax=Ditylenchus destructor TaxID=166010 RepID=A0AAD4MXU7_9BILA|nr:hypothetical protein DdX_11624 [Ditylenchus destructor]
MALFITSSYHQEVYKRLAMKSNDDESNIGLVTRVTTRSIYVWGPTHSLREISVPKNTNPDITWGDVVKYTITAPMGEEQTDTLLEKITGHCFTILYPAGNESQFKVLTNLVFPPKDSDCYAMQKKVTGVKFVAFSKEFGQVVSFNDLAHEPGKVYKGYIARLPAKFDYLIQQIGTMFLVMKNELKEITNKAEVDYIKSWAPWNRETATDTMEKSSFQPNHHEVNTETTENISYQPWNRETDAETMEKQPCHGISRESIFEDNQKETFFSCAGSPEIDSVFPAHKHQQIPVCDQSNQNIPQDLIDVENILLENPIQQNLASSYDFKASVNKKPHYSSNEFNDIDDVQSLFNKDICLTEPPTMDNNSSVDILQLVGKCNTEKDESAMLGNVVSKHHQDLQSHGQMQKAKMFKKAIIKLMLEYDFDE